MQFLYLSHVGTVMFAALEIQGQIAQPFKRIFMFDFSWFFG